jgi:hypothetical protein
MTQAPVGIDERRDGGLPDDVGSGTREDGSLGNLVEVLGDSDHPVRIVPREVGADEMARHLLGDLGVGPDRSKQCAREPLEGLGRTDVEFWHA